MSMEESVARRLGPLLGVLALVAGGYWLRGGADAAPAELERFALEEAGGSYTVESVRWVGRVISIFDARRQYGLQRAGLFFAARMEHAPDFEFRPGDVVDVRGRITGRTRFGAVYVNAESMTLLERAADSVARASAWSAPRGVARATPGPEEPRHRPFPSLPGVWRSGEVPIGVPEGPSMSGLLPVDPGGPREEAEEAEEDRLAAMAGTTPTTASKGTSRASTGPMSMSAGSRRGRSRKPGGGRGLPRAFGSKGPFGLWRPEWGRMARPSSPDGGSL